MEEVGEGAVETEVFDTKPTPLFYSLVPNIYLRDHLMKFLRHVYMMDHAIQFWSKGLRWDTRLA